MDRRIVITGVGVFSPVGIGFDAYSQALLAGTSGIRPVARFQTGEFPGRASAEVPAFKTRDYVPEEHKKAIKVMSWDVQLGVVAAMSAVVDAKIIPSLSLGKAAEAGAVPSSAQRVPPTRLGVSFGCGNIASDPGELSTAYSLIIRDGHVDYKAAGTELMKGLTPLWLLKYLPNMPACHVSIFIDAQGPNNSLTTGDAASLEAIGEAYRVMNRGWSDVMVCGGVDAKVNVLSLVRCQLLGWSTVKDGAPETLARPFEKSRSGFVVGEGAGSIVLEGLEHALARGATIYGEVFGFGGGCDARGLNGVDPDGRGVRNAMKNALRDAKMAPSNVDAIFANASGLVEGDRAEARAIARIFGAGPKAPPVTATRSMIGQTSSAGGILDALAALAAIKAGTLPPTLNYDVPDPECPVNVVKPGASAAKKLDRILINNGGFGGQFASLVVGRYHG